MWGIPFVGVLFFVSGGYMVILKEKGYVDITAKLLNNKKYVWLQLLMPIIFTMEKISTMLMVKQFICFLE